jgi:hypothetical protein
MSFSKRPRSGRLELVSPKSRARDASCTYGDESRVSRSSMALLGHYGRHYLSKLKLKGIIADFCDNADQSAVCGMQVWLRRTLTPILDRSTHPLLIST